MGENLTESKYPRIEVDYMFDSEEKQHIPRFEAAGDAYAETRSEGEDFTVSVLEGESFTFVTFGKNVLQALSYAEIGHQNDEMQKTIEELTGLAGSEDILRPLRAGQMMKGLLPDPE